MVGTITSGESFNRIVDALQAHGSRIDQQGDGSVMAQCPVHADNNPSLHVSYVQSEGKTLLKCFAEAGCENVDILTVLGLQPSDLFDNPLPASPFEASPFEASRDVFASARGLNAGVEVSHLREVGVFRLPASYVDTQGQESQEVQTLCRLLVEAHGKGRENYCPVCTNNTLTLKPIPLLNAVLVYCSHCGGGSTFASAYAQCTALSAGQYYSNGREMVIFTTTEGVCFDYPDGAQVFRRVQVNADGSHSKAISNRGAKGVHLLYLSDKTSPYVAGHTIFIVEGEKDAATMWAYGYAAVSPLGGAQGVKAHTDPLQLQKDYTGADIIVVVDRDASGEQFAKSVQEALADAPRSIRFIQAKGDAHDMSDALIRGHTEFALMTWQTPSIEAGEGDASGDVEAEDVDPRSQPPEWHAQRIYGDQWRYFESIWDEAPYLKPIRDAARQCGVSAFATLVCVLAYVAGAIPPHVVVTDAYADSYGSLNMFVGILGVSGGGKSKAAKLAKRLINFGTHAPHTTEAASGESIPTMFARRQRAKTEDKDDKPQPMKLTVQRSRVMLKVDEITSMGAVQERKGSTLTSTLLSAWNGDNIGQETKDETKQVRLPEHVYRLCMVTGVQPENLGSVISQGGSGLPQRFLWAHIIDPFTTTTRHEPTKPVYDIASEIEADKRSQDYPLGILQKVYDSGLGDVWADAYRLHAVEYPENTGEYLEAFTWNTSHGYDNGNALFSQRPLLQMKVAALLPWLDPSRENRFLVTEQDWRVASIIMNHSQWAIEYAQTELKAKQIDRIAESHEKTERGKAKAATNIRHDMQRTKAAILRHLAKAPKYTLTLNDLRRKIGRDVSTEVEQLEKARQVVQTVVQQPNGQVSIRVTLAQKKKEGVEA